MKMNFKATAAILLLAGTSAYASASPVTLGSITHDYGTTSGVNATNTFQSCDTVNATSITVKATSNCARFLDYFDFSTLSYTSISKFSLTLKFADTASILESWAMRPASSGLVGSTSTQNLTKSGAATSQTFTIDNLSNPDVFNVIVANKSFALWFANNGFSGQNFTLDSATLDVVGESVPEPTSLALFGIAAAAITVSMRARRKNANG